jgi:hypothetical protein
MLRRMIALALAGLAVAAPPALASPHWNSQVKNGSATASRDAGGCSIGAGSQAGSLLVTCSDHERASLVYVFSTRHSVAGRPTYSIGSTGHAGVWGSARVIGNSVRVTVTVCGDGGAQLNTVSVGYYSRS